MQKYDSVRLTGHLLRNSWDFLSNKKLNLMYVSVHHIWKWREIPTWWKNLFIII